MLCIFWPFSSLSWAAIKTDRPAFFSLFLSLSELPCSTIVNSFPHLSRTAASATNQQPFHVSLYLIVFLWLHERGEASQQPMPPLPSSTHSQQQGQGNAGREGGKYYSTGGGFQGQLAIQNRTRLEGPGDERLMAEEEEEGGE